MRYFIQLSYDGTGYHGWQVQPNGVSVQEVLQKALSTLLRQPTEVTGAGRTDAGVHASMMVAHFDWPAAHEGEGCEEAPLDCTQLTYKLNRLLPPDVAVQAVRPVGPEMHARFSATRRTYHYYIHTRKDPFLRGYSWQVNVPLDFALMNEAAQVLLEYSDFTSFSKTGTDVKTNICQLTEARWEQLKPGEWRFTVSANRFLRNMVRAIVGTLVEVGRHRMTISQMRHAIEAKDRQRAGESVPGHALYLTNIEY
ncbi:MAG: tRNA pseudouridine(38-40) synthase TruA [Bacteroidaceae bacterium]|nr:tRNA pseudouridine(38-40) synthase TruA [Prevotellaceae bacterium]MDD7658936.1 tRNA pseudouridine(38-40) synthase TruA [Prevotellaceae bacterium]MDY5598532.1 tRNA pseudouridine(38-40) synthase TruA [Bacteroidaceae bacterium]MDY5673390.1 tRNA pseudouridine(38-40) synthase TruA [Bacteroidaceae bacterium]MEE1241857.1 tRNA pseudouridine(38-40) synthase TruA [Bacteroidaceae bacterium]